MIELKLYKSPWVSIKLMLGCLLFVGIGYFMLGRPDAPHWVAWLSIVFFGLGFPVGIYQLLDRRPQIIINEFGIFDRTTHHEFINWEIIQDVYLAQVHKQHIICLIVDEVFEPSRRKNKFRQGVASFGKQLGFQELNLTLTYLDVDAQRLAEFVLAMRGAERPTREEMVRKAIANL
ncbi:STM3941 family protein [Hymenobacter humi]|uniref:STM3941 family protein n=1 Tax=Hymenobacter humi TaxID=1411620 RepID=A0ABW2U3T9_9BACT